MKKILFLLSISFLLLLIHCEDKDKRFDEFDRAPYVAFVKKPPNVVGLKAIKDLTYEVTITASQVKKYQLDLTAELSGEQTDTVTLGTFNTFPVHLKYTAEDFSKALKKEVADISFGDSFHFIGTATGDNGTVYYPSYPKYERIVILKGDTITKPVIPKGAMVKKEVTQEGDTVISILQKRGMLDKDEYDPNHRYNQAYSFGFTIACPGDSYTKEAIVGTYEGFQNPFSGESYPLKVVAGTEENEFIIKSFMEKDKDFTFSASAENPQTDIKKQDVFTHPKYGMVKATGKALILPCLGTIQLNLKLCVSAGCFRPMSFTFKKKE